MWLKPYGPLAPLCRVLGVDGRGRQGLPKEVPGGLFILRCSCGDESGLSHKCGNPCNREGAASGTGAGKRGKVASCHSLSPVIVQPGLHKCPLILGVVGPAAPEQGGTFRLQVLVGKRVAAPLNISKWRSGKSGQVERTVCS